MKKAKAVIGAVFGDEGKGLMTDYLASQQKNALVVRYSGGANAGHTVQLPDGRRHVFGHFGSGTLVGGRTFLSRFFIVNPMLWEKEAAELSNNHGVTPAVWIDPAAKMTLPCDMLINQFLEDARGMMRHGTVGVGINETEVRSAHERWKTPAALLDYPAVLRGRIMDIMTEYVPFRLEQLGLELKPDQEKLIRSTAIVDKYMQSVDYMNASESYLLMAWDKVAAREKSFIFEGSQGLLLDAKNDEFFPNVTNARTGLTNIMQLSSEADIDHVEAIYATRAYSTRHGAGDFPCEVSDLSFEDATNLKNPWQGRLRFGWLDMDRLESAILHDLLDADYQKIEWSLAMTCLDQVEGHKPCFYRGGELHQVPAWSDVVEEAAKLIGALNRYTSHGPTRDHVMMSIEKGELQ